MIVPELCPSFLHAQEYYQDEPVVGKKQELPMVRVRKISKIN